MPRGSDEFGGPEAGRSKYAISERPGYGTYKVRGAVGMINVLHVDSVGQVEHLCTTFQLHTLRDRKQPLQPDIYIVIRIAFVGVASYGPDAVVKGEDVAVRVETGIDGEEASALQSTE